MILQGSLRLEYKDIFYLLNVKTILKDDVYYFYITDKDLSHALLAGETIELSYSDSFCATEQNEVIAGEKVSRKIVSAIEKLILDNKDLWYY